MGVWVKSFRIATIEPFQQSFFVAAIDDVITNQISFLKRVDHQIMTVLGDRLATGGHRFLVGSFAMDDTGDRLLGVGAHAFPDAHHITAGGVHKLAALGLELLPNGDFRAERRDDHNITFAQIIDIRRLMGAGQEVNAHLPNLVVYLRVMDDFPQNIERLVREHLARGVGKVDAALDAVAKAEFLRELDGNLTGRAGHFALGPQSIDQITTIMRQHLRLDLLHNIRPAQVNALGLRLGNRLIRGFRSHRRQLGTGALAGSR